MANGGYGSPHSGKCFTSRSYNYGFRYIFHFKVNYGSPLTGILHRSPRWFYPSLRRSSSSLLLGSGKIEFYTKQPVSLGGQFTYSITEVFYYITVVLIFVFYLLLVFTLCCSSTVTHSQTQWYNIFSNLSDLDAAVLVTVVLSIIGFSSDPIG